jgi:hypothetical protein
MARYLTVWKLPVASMGALVGVLALAPAASAAGTRGSIVPVAFLGIPSLHSIIEAIAKGFFGALAGALVPGFLKHATVATIQHLVALPDPAGWRHVSELEGDMTYLGVSLMPVTLTVCTLRYWVVGLTGAAHPATGLARCAGATFMLVIYRWLIEQTVAATNTLTHAILAFPVVANGLASIITVLFGGALLIGAGGVFGAFLVFFGVAFAAGLFASQSAILLILALAYFAGPLLIALWPIPELSHLMRVWAHALMAVVLVPVGWTILFATAGALSLDATDFTGGAPGIGGHIEAAFAGLITFLIALKLPLMLFGELRHILGSATLQARGAGGGGAQGQATMPGAQRIRASHARLRTIGLEGLPSLGRSVGRAAGALGAPVGGPIGAARRGFVGAASRSGLAPRVAAAAGVAGGTGAAVAARKSPTGGGRGGIRERFARAGTILAKAPGDAKAAMVASARKQAGSPARFATKGAAARPSNGTGAQRKSASTATGKTPAKAASQPAPNRAAGRPQTQRPGSSRTPPVQTKPQGQAQAKPRSVPAPVPPAPAQKAALGKPGAAHPGRKVTASAQREVATPASAPGKAGGGQRSRPRETRTKPPAPSRGPGVQGSRERPSVTRKPRPRPQS